MCAIRNAYRFTVKFLALLVPAKVATVTLTLPYMAFAGTLHLICVALQETYVVHVLLPNFTALVPCDAADTRTSRSLRGRVFGGKSAGP